MTFYTNNTVEMMMVLNSFGPRFDPQSIPSYSDWVANTTFDPFGPDPLTPTSYLTYPDPGTPFHLQTRNESRVDPGHASSQGDMTHNFSQEVSSDPPSEDCELEIDAIISQRSRFPFAQTQWVEHPTDANVSRIPATRVPRSPVGRLQTPTPIKATSKKVQRVVGPRPLRVQHAPHVRREPTIVVPKPAYPLPTWLTHFEDHEEELLAEFCPPSGDSSPSTATFPAIVRIELPSEHIPECPPLDTAPLLGFANLGSPDIEAGGRFPEEGEDFDEDYDRCELDIDSDFGSDYVSMFGSGVLAPENHGAGTFDWPTPYQGPVADGEGLLHEGASTLLDFPQSHPLHPSPDPRVAPDPLGLAVRPLNSLPWSVFTNSLTRAPINDADRSLTEMEEGLRAGSGSGSVSEPCEGEVEGWYDRFDLTGYTFPVPPQQPHSPRVVVEFEAPPLVHTAAIPLPHTEEDGDAELDIVIVSRNSGFEW